MTPERVARGPHAIALAAALAIVAAALVPGVCAAARVDRPAAIAPATLLFDDEFAGSRLDSTKWNTCYFWATRGGCTNNPGLELEWYRPSQVTVGGGLLSLTAIRTSTHRNLPYTSGMISTGDCCGRPLHFSFLYGYMEMSAMPPPGHGMWPAFWLIPASHAWPPEIDAMEWQGQQPRTNYLTLHYVGANGEPAQSGGTYVGPNLSHGFHRFGCEWSADRITWYEDGRAVRTYSDRRQIPSVPMYVIVNLAIGGWVSFPNGRTPFPATMQVKYVRVWDRKP